MAFSGSLNAIALPDIVQLVGMAQKSGILTIVTDRGRFTILFRNGCVTDAAAVRFAVETAAGDDGGDSPKKEIQIRANLTDDPERGMSLQEMASKIVRLNTGYFNFQAGDPPTESDIALDVSNLLLESLRQHDEAIRDGTHQPDDYESLTAGDGAPEEEAGAGAGAADETAFTPPRPDPIRHLYNAFKMLAEHPGERTLRDLVLDAAQHVFDRAILFRVGERDLYGGGGYRPSDTGNLIRLDEVTAAIRIPRSVTSLLEDAVDGGRVGIGRASETWWREFIPREFGPPPVQEYVALPVMVGDDCALVLYGDTYAHRDYADHLRALEILCSHVGVRMENTLLRIRGRDVTNRAVAAGMNNAYEPNEPMTPPSRWAERRVALRRRVHLESRVLLVATNRGENEEHDLFSFVGYTRDISESGLAVITSGQSMQELFRLGTTYSLQLVVTLPTGPIELSATPVRSQPLVDSSSGGSGEGDEAAEHYLIGARITDMSGRDRARFIDYIRTLT